MSASVNKKTNSITSFKCVYDDALDIAGFGRYTFGMLATCCLLILAMYLDIFGLSVALPAAACDLHLSTLQQAMLSAIPLIGVMVSSYVWGACADTLGRRATLLGAMTLGVILNVAVTLAPTYQTLAALKFFSAAFTASANAAAFVLMGETTPRRHRNQFMFLMASATMLVQFLICLFALPILQLSFGGVVPWLGLEYRPWRLLLLVISAPGALGLLGLGLLHESPKFLLSKGRDEEALLVLTNMYATNHGLHKETYPVTSVYLEEGRTPVAVGASLPRRLWSQTAPLFQPPLLKNSLKLYFILLCAYMTSTGYTMWVPTMTNAFFNGEDTSGKTFCEVASTATSSSNSTSVECDKVIEPSTLYAVMCYSGVSGALNVVLSFAVGRVGRRRCSLLVFGCSAAAGVALLFVTKPLLSVALFYIFLYVALILGNVNSYLVELNPTHLRGMATCLSVVVARGFGFGSVQLISALLHNHCTPMIAGYVALVCVGGVVAFFLPPDDKKQESTKTNGEDHSQRNPAVLEDGARSTCNLWTRF